MFDFAMVPEIADDVAIAPQLPDYEALNLGDGCGSIKKEPHTTLHFLAMVTESARPVVPGSHPAAPGLGLPGDLVGLAPTAAGEAETFDIRSLCGVDEDVDEVLSMLSAEEDEGDDESANLAAPVHHRSICGAASRSPSPLPARKSAYKKKGPPKSPTRGRQKASKSKSRRECSPLPPDHQPARGRGRAAQLASMTEAQIVAEAAIRAEKNRQAARECRLRRKDHVANLKTKASGLEKKYGAAMKTIKQLRARLAKLEQQEAL